jgi:hypothetical protein
VRRAERAGSHGAAMSRVFWLRARSGAGLRFSHAWGGVSAGVS